MRKSRAITLTVLSGLMLTGCCVSMSGCGRRHPEPPDHTWHDASGNPVPEKWKTDESGKQVLDDKDRPIPEPFPHDRYGRPWVYNENGVLVPQPPPAGSSSTSHPRSSGLWLWGGSGYRSTGGSSYRPGGGTSSPGRSSTSSAPSGSSINRGGFGSTGMGSSSS
jgi:hypothetical protein